MYKDKIERLIHDAIHFLEERNYSSFDQFDALESPLINWITAPSDLTRRIAIQLNKNLPFNIRPILGYKPMVHTKTLSDMLTVYSMLYANSHNKEWQSKAHKMFERLKERALHFENGIGWGLNFAYTTRFVNAKKDTPNLYNTLNAAHSLMDYYEEVGSEEVLAIIPQVAAFMNGYLGYVKIDDSSGWFRYYPGQTIPNFNVNATSASFFVRANKLCKKEIVPKKVIEGLLNFLTKYQNDDGSWYYALSDNGRWIDGYHTGFILDALLYLDEVKYEYPIQQALNKGIQFYQEHLFAKDGIPKYFHNSLYPVEAQNCAQAIQSLSKCLIGMKDVKEEFVHSVVDQSIHYLYDESGYFYYKKGRFFTNKQFYSRWSQTPMIMALLYFTKVQIHD